MVVPVLMARVTSKKNVLERWPSGYFPPSVDQFHRVYTVSNIFAHSRGIAKKLCM